VSVTPRTQESGIAGVTGSSGGSPRIGLNSKDRHPLAKAIEYV